MKETYGKEIRLNKQNNKVKGTTIRSTDTIRGCANKCESCWAKKNTCRTIEKFEVPVKVEKFVGKVSDTDWYRFGNQGDPGTDWKFSEKTVKKLNIKNHFVVTKLMTLKGFTGFFNNLQVSVDPLMEKHFWNTLKNVETILKKYPQVRIVLRVRSCSSYNLRILSLQNTVVTFANINRLPIMETRMRFNRKDSIEKYDLVKEDYFMSTGKQTKPVWGKRFIIGADKYYDCDLYGAKCKDCSNCTSTWTTKQFERKGDFIAPSKSKGVYKEAA